MKGTFTPGPWTIARNGVLTIGAPGGGNVAHVLTPMAGDREANARLIAAAPELAAFTAEYARYGCECDDVPQACGPCRARALLARIEGRDA